ncbi:MULTISPECIES: tyrosine-protein phosphatase [Vagococcus]|uniref:Protein tyrosine/serine phosphatase-like protein n=1 Tax=Vagococcus fluvialis bH819 TaxID=1255619 RepID=A0A1X6WSF8_9ENTE|nr:MULTISPECIES: tyrosine-protein phosphatase [Vagococcus]SLM87162.1 protein tyrosine/serine phosphatase-like protein [Vagococcus fluvialis bH819]HCM90026.1 protein-tyrosine-phosphatase [Vagococcus sp.]
MNLSHRLVLDTTFNTRELGGIPLNNQQVVKWQQLLRSDDVSFLSEVDIASIKKYGINTVIDLRTEQERRETGYTLTEDKEIVKHYISLMISDNVMDITQAETEMTLGSFYCKLLDESKEQFKEIFEVFASDESKGVLFHCAAGKDRTGVVAALMLNLLGANEADIIANYEVTYSYLSANPKFEAPDMYRHLINSDREHMIIFLDKLNKEYGNAEEYLKNCGVSVEKINNLKEKYR